LKKNGENEVAEKSREEAYNSIVNYVETAERQIPHRYLYGGVDGGVEVVLQYENGKLLVNSNKYRFLIYIAVYVQKALFPRPT